MCLCCLVYGRLWSLIYFEYCITMILIKFTHNSPLLYPITYVISSVYSNPWDSMGQNEFVSSLLAQKLITFPPQHHPSTMEGMPGCLRCGDKKQLGFMETEKKKHAQSFRDLVFLRTSCILSSILETEQIKNKLVRLTQVIQI